MFQVEGAQGQMIFGKNIQDYELTDVLPDASDFVRRETYWEAYALDEGGNRDLIGYVFLSDDLTRIPGYSGQSINTLLGIDISGMITGVKIVEHSEPIVLLGLSEEAIHTFARQYIGKNIRERVIISDSPREGYTAVDAITGATVTAIAENTTILEASRLVATQAGILTGPEISSKRLKTDYVEHTWDSLVESGSIANMVIMPKDISQAGDQPVVDLWFTILNPPTIGQNMLGERSSRLIEERLNKGEIALYVGSSGSISFKGSGFARGGIFDRFALEQGGGLFICKDMDYINFPQIEIEGSPYFDEGGIFFFRSPFNPTESFTFHLTIPFRINDVRNYATFTLDFTLPDEFIEEEVPFWMVRWQSYSLTVTLFTLFIILVASQFFLIRQIAPRKTLVETWKVLSWTVAALLVGLYLKAQPSTTQVLTFFTSSVHFRFPSEIYLSEPVIFLFWITIFLSIPLWGRGFFCGWLCPYGAFLELLRKPWDRFAPMRMRKKIDRWSPPPYLRFVKYVILLIILGVSLISLASAEILAEVEPFKTYILHLARPLYFVAYFLLITVISIILYRFFCRFICPLGAALAIPSRRPLRSLERYDHCGTCRICEHECLSQAIEKTTGKIDHSECFQCWSCQANMQDQERCPVIIKTKNSNKRNHHLVGATVIFFLLSIPQLYGETWTVGKGNLSLQEMIAEAIDGDTLHVEPGVYPGPVMISKRITVLGSEGSIIDGGGKGHVLVIDSPDVNLSGFLIRNSGDDMENADSGIWVSKESGNVMLKGNTIVDCRFGIWVNGSRGIQIIGNRIEGRTEQDQNSRGDGIHFWDSNGAQVEHNVITDTRDGIYMELSTDCKIIGNEIRRSRYSVHTMWCDRSKYNENTASGNLVGLALMFSKGLEANGNILHNNTTHGLLLIQVTRSFAEKNRIIGNTKGLFVYNSLYNTIRDNLIVKNSLGIHYWAGSEDNEITNNTLIHNKIQVKFVAAHDQFWDNNFWSDFIGWDADNDGKGDTAYRSHTLVDALLWNYPTARLLLASPSFQFLALAERTFPVISVPKVIDNTPMMEPPVSDWTSIVERFPPAPQEYYGEIKKLPHIPGGE
jgi:NosR/NirI family nitrous oxide reductase transcriptional regulator